MVAPESSAAKAESITNNGLIAGARSDVVELASVGKIIHSAGAAILGGSEGTFARNCTAIENAGTIAATGEFGAGIPLFGSRWAREGRSAKQDCLTSAI